MVLIGIGSIGSHSILDLSSVGRGEGGKKIISSVPYEINPGTSTGHIIFNTILHNLLKIDQRQKYAENPVLFSSYMVIF